MGRSDDDLVASIAEDCIANRVRLLNRAVTAIYDEALRPHGLTIAQMSVLVTIAKMDAPSPGSLVGALHMEKSTVSRNVDRMRARGWVESVPTEDGRARRLRVTARGRKLLRETHAAWSRAQRRATAILGEQGISGIARSAHLVKRARDRMAR